MTQLRFKKDRLLDDHFYIRGDGTRVYFFEESIIPFLILRLTVQVNWKRYSGILRLSSWL